MKRQLQATFLAATLMLSGSGFAADQKISDMTAATSTAAADLLPIVQSGANKKATVDMLTGFTTLGDTLYGGTSGTRSRLAGNTTTTKNFLSQTGDGANSAAPAWSTVAKSDVGLGNVENTALSTWAGTTNITTAGTLTSGTWSATAIGPTKGGTGLTSYTLGDLPYASASNTLAALAGNTTTTKKFLTQTGNGSVSAAPAWGTIANTDVSGLGTASVKAYTDTAEANLGSPTFTAGGNPTSLTYGKYKQTQIGNFVMITARAEYGSAGSTVTKVTYPLPGPNPTDWTGQATTERMFSCAASMGTSATGSSTARGSIQESGSGTYLLVIEAASGSYTTFDIQCNYPTGF